MRLLFAAVLAVLLVSALVVIVPIFAYRERIVGPTSPSGITVEISVSDAVPWNVGSDYFADVMLIRPGKDYESLFWSDQSGQHSRQAVDELVSSMQWVGPSELEFDTAEGPAVRISLTGHFWRLEEFARTAAKNSATD